LFEAYKRSIWVATVSAFLLLYGVVIVLVTGPAPITKGTVASLLADKFRTTIFVVGRCGRTYRKIRYFTVFECAYFDRETDFRNNFAS